MSSVNPAAGVYTKETNLSQRVGNVATAICVLIGGAQKGPVNQRTLVLDNADYDARFGNKDSRYGHMPMCADAVTKEANRTYITRLVNNALTAGAYLTRDDPTAVRPRLALTNFDDGTNNPQGVVDPINNLGFLATDPDANNNLLYVCAENPGRWNHEITVRIRPSNPAGRPVGIDHDLRHFYIEVFLNYTGTRNSPVEKYLVSRRRDEVDEEGRALFVEDVINRYSQNIRVKNNPFCDESTPIWETVTRTFAGATDGDAVTHDQVAAAWAMYDDAENIDVNLLVNCGYASPNVQRSMNAVAVSRQDALAILDIPENSTEVAHAIQYRRNDLNLASSYSAIYTPWLQVRNTTTKKNTFIPPSGAVAAAMCRTIATRALWFATAGIRRGNLNVKEVSTRYKKGGHDALDKAQINCIRKMPNRGYVILGAETLDPIPSSLQWVPVRLLFNFLKKSVATAAAFAPFEPNDTFLRGQLRGIATTFLAPIKQGRGLRAYDVVCDERNNTPADEANGDVHLDIWADPVIVAKRIHLTAHLQRSGSVDFGEF